MSVCTQCGHALGVGRFCTNCGHPVAAGPVAAGPVAAGPDDDWRTGTAERPAVPVERAQQYPLYADEAAPHTGGHRHLAPRPERGARWLPWVVAGVVLVLVAALGVWLLAGADDDPTRPEPRDRKSSRAEPSPSEREEPESPTEGPEPGPSRDPADVARFATATVPATAPPNQDVDGNLVRYEARNMLDGVPQTCWRMPGDGTGEAITIDLEGTTSLSSVGLVNGYAKTATAGGATLDWYRGNRRVLAAEWTFDDGTTVTQELTETRELQVLDLDGVTTGSVVLRLLEVSPPGRGPSARNYTAISEVSLVGTPA